MKCKGCQYCKHSFFKPHKYCSIQMFPVQVSSTWCIPTWKDIDEVNNDSLCLLYSKKWFWQFYRG